MTEQIVPMQGIVETRDSTKNCLCERRCTWSATEQAGEDTGGCGVLERAKGGGRGHSGEGSAPVAAVDHEDRRASGGRALDSGEA